MTFSLLNRKAGGIFCSNSGAEEVEEGRCLGVLFPQEARELCNACLSVFSAEGGNLVRRTGRAGEMVSR